MAEPRVFVLSVPGVNRLEFQVQVGVRAKASSFEFVFLALHSVVAVPNIAATAEEEWGGGQQGMGVCLQLPLSRLNKRTFFQG